MLEKKKKKNGPSCTKKNVGTPKENRIGTAKKSKISPIFFLLHFMAMVILTATVQRFIVSLKRDFSLYIKRTKFFAGCVLDSRKICKKKKNPQTKKILVRELGIREKGLTRKWPVQPKTKECNPIYDRRTYYLI